MAKISRITTQKKHTDRYNIFLDDGQKETYGFSVHESVLVEHRLHKDMELSEALMTTLIKQDTFHKAYSLAIHYLSYRMRTKQEIRDYLARKETDDDHIDAIMEKLESHGLTDDKQFADAFVRTRMNTSNKGPGLLRQELLEKGVEGAIALDAVGQYTYEQQFDKAMKLATKKRKTTGSKSFSSQLLQLKGTLIQKGFSHDVAHDVISEIQDDKDDDAEWQALVTQGEKLLNKHRIKLDGFALRNKMKEALYRKGFTIDMINQFIEQELDG
ncbi:recombination regulator RecX [Lentibacillus halophilus]|uniref:Regulatory protein RecX n=1 Tax=Lentibacillus halophilus TaxID=295065 RepID=A0ABP3J468_9BACI